MGLFIKDVRGLASRRYTLLKYIWLEFFVLISGKTNFIRVISQIYAYESLTHDISQKVDNDKICYLEADTLLIIKLMNKTNF